MRTEVTPESARTWDDRKQASLNYLYRARKGVLGRVVLSCVGVGGDILIYLHY
jgi:hypothetical protein